MFEENKVFKEKCLKISLDFRWHSIDKICSRHFAKSILDRFDYLKDCAFSYNATLKDRDICDIFSHILSLPYNAPRREYKKTNIRKQKSNIMYGSTYLNSHQSIPASHLCR